MAPQIGPNDAPTMCKKPIKFWATPVTASTMDTVTPAMVEGMRGTPGIMDEKVLPAINAQKQAGATAAMADRAHTEVASKPPMDRITSSYPSPGSAYSLLAPATE